MKFFFGLFIISIIIMFYGLIIDNQNLIISFGFLSISSIIISTSIGKEEILKEIYEKFKTN